MAKKKQEKLDDHKVIDSGLPEGRFDGKVHVPNQDVIVGDDNDKLTGGKPISTGKTLLVKPTSLTKVEEKGLIGGVSLGADEVGAFSAAGVSGVSAVTDNSKIPYTAGGRRPFGRQGKVAAQADFIIENAASEQIDPQFEGVKTLSEQPEALQGYNGRKTFKTPRGKKIYGTAPQTVLFDRSADIVEFDKTIHTSGQILNNIAPTAGYPTMRSFVDGDGRVQTETIDQPMRKSNYLLKELVITMESGRVAGIRFNEDEIESHIDADSVLQANLNWQTDQNNTAKTVLKLQKELGRETTDQWSPLGYVINQPYETNQLMADIESTAGAMQSLAYRSNVSALAYQMNNVLAKRGAAGQLPIVEMIYGGIGDLQTSNTSQTILDANGGSLHDAIFGRESLRHGLATGIIEMFDSTRKYTSKGSFANMPKGFKQFLDKMQSNIGVLRMHEKVAKAIDVAHVFSTPDGDYDPTQPIFQTRRISVMNPISLNYFLKDWDRNAVSSDNPAGTAPLFGYSYNDIRTEYYMPIKNFLVDGIVSWLIKHEPALTKAYGEDAVIRIPAFFDMLHPTMFSQILAAASQEILIRRTVDFKDVLFAGDQTEYIYSHLSTVEELDPLRSRNLTISGWDSPLQLGKLDKTSKLHIFFGEQFTILGSNDGLLTAKEVSILMPWYYNEQAFRNEYSVNSGFASHADDRFVMSMPEIRLGTNHEYINFIYDEFADEREVRLALDRGISIPQPMTKVVNNTVYTDSRYVFNTSSADMNAGIRVHAFRYDNESDGRVVATYTNGVTRRVIPTKASLLAIPRELGLIFESGRSAPIIVAAQRSGNQVTLTLSGNLNVNNAIDGSNSFKMISYQADSPSSSGAILRSASLRQKFSTYFADRSMHIVNRSFIDVVGFSPSISDLFLVDNQGRISLDTNTTQIPGVVTLNGRQTQSLTNVGNITTLSRFFWSMLNRFYLPVNPFVGNTVAFNADSPASGMAIDPLEVAFYFGVAGTLASDFGQDVDRRSVIYETLGLDYTSDEFIKDSPITYDR